jgi:transcriptional regulator with XRE-family HTH domain
MGTNSVNLTKLLVVDTVQEKIGPYIAQLLKDKGLNYREVARRSGGEISHSAVGDIINGRVSDIGIGTLRGLARGLGVPEQELLEVAIGKPEAGAEERRLIWYFSQLPEEQRQDVLTTVEALYKRRREQNAKPIRKERSKSSTSKIVQSSPKRRDAIDEAIDVALAYGGGPISDIDRQRIREILEKQDKESEESA